MADEEKTQDRKKGRFFKAMLLALAGAFGLVLLLVVLAAGIVFFRPQLLEPILVHTAATFGYRAEYSEFSVSIDPPSLKVKDLRLVSDDLTEDPRRSSTASGMNARIPAVNLVLDLREGWESGVWIDVLEVESPDVTVFAGGEGQGAGGNPLRYLSLFKELVVSGGDFEILMPGGTLSVRELWVGVGGGEKELERTFRISAGAGFRNATAQGRPLVDITASVQGTISPDGVIAADLNVSDGGIEGPLAAAFSGAADLRAKGEDIVFESLDIRAESLRIPAGGMGAVKTGELELKLSGALNNMSGLDMAFVNATASELMLSPPGLEEVSLRKLQLDLDDFSLDLKNMSELGMAFANATALDLSVTFPGREPRSLQRVDLNLSNTRLDTAQPGLQAESFSLVLPEIARLDGSAELSSESLAITAEGRILSLAMALDKAGGLLPAAVNKYSAQGDLPFAISFAGDLDSPEMILELRPGDVRISGDGIGLEVSGNLDLKGEMKGSLNLSGAIETEGSYAIGDLKADNASASAQLAGTLEEPAFESLRLDLPAGGLVLPGAAPDVGGLGIYAGRATVSGDNLRISGLKLDSERLGEMSGSVNLDLKDPAGSTGELSAKGLDAALVFSLLTETGLVDLELTDVTGSLGITARLKQAGGNAAIALEADFSGLGLGAGGGDILLGGIAGSIAMNAGLSMPRRINAGASIDSGEALIDTYYIDFGSYPADLEIETTMTAADAFSDSQIRFNLAGVGTAELSGAKYYKEGGASVYAGRLEVEDPNLDKALEVFVKEPLSFARPDLADLAVNGTASFSCDFQGRGSVVDVSGLLELSEMDVDYPAREIAASNLSLSLPYAYRFGETTAGPSREQVEDWGEMSWSSMTLPTGKMQAGAMTPALAANVFHTRGHQRIPLPGGMVILGPVRLDEPFSKVNVHLETSAVLKSLDLSRLPTGGIALSGEVAGKFPTITADTERLDAIGEVQGTFFGGVLEARGVGMLRPFSTGRVYGLEEMSITGIELEPLSQSLDIGLITGRLDIGLMNYRQSFGQPVAFEISAESREVEGVPQKVSLKAVNSISVMGTGSGLGDVGVGMFSSFFETFSYEAIGIYCSLQNDVFRVRGLIDQGDVEYLIKKPLFFGINVINRNPNNRISFSDMVERVQRVVGDETDVKVNPKEES